MLVEKKRSDPYTHSERKITLVRFSSENSERLGPVETIHDLGQKPHCYMTAKEIKECQTFSQDDTQAKALLLQLETLCTKRYRSDQ